MNTRKRAILRGCNTADFITITDFYRLIVFAEQTKADYVDKFLPAICLSDGTLWEAETALYFRGFCLPDCTVVWVTADYERSNRTLS